jgi:hypothetical protein
MTTIEGSIRGRYPDIEACGPEAIAQCLNKALAIDRTVRNVDIMQFFPFMGRENLRTDIAQKRCQILLKLLILTLTHTAAPCCPLTKNA